MQISADWFWAGSYTLRQAEEELVGACLDHESALRLALDLLPLDDFRGSPHEIRDIFYALAGWLERGAYDSKTNRERLLPLFGLSVKLNGAGYLGGLWCPWGMNRDYVSALCEAIARSNEAADAAVAAERHWRAVRLDGQAQPTSMATTERFRR